MKVIFEFNLPDDEYDYKIYSNALKYNKIIGDFEEYLRSKYKYIDEKEWPKFEEVRQEFYDIKNEELLED